MVKKTKSSKKWKQLLASAIVTPNLFVVSTEILDEISTVLFSTLFKISQDQSLAVLPNMMLFGRSLLVLEAKQLSPIVLPLFKNWTDQIKTESFSLLVSGAAADNTWKTITSH
ncbi:hypothetical protein G9A89_023237 [Geosiphon pyriformis]|nr:hypothetical protein G9A89_023237 [Geosiphon pyriformis]